MYLSTGSTKAITPEDLLETTGFNTYYDTGGGLIGFCSGSTPSPTIGNTQAIGKLSGCNYKGNGMGSFEFYCPVTIKTNPLGSLTKLTSNGSTFKFLSTDPADWSISTYTAQLGFGGNASDAGANHVVATLTGKTGNSLIDVIQHSGLTWNAGGYYGLINIQNSAPFIILRYYNNSQLLDVKGSTSTKLKYINSSNATSMKTVEFYGPRHSVMFFNNKGTLVLLN